jgi:hypothetical protein
VCGAPSLLLMTRRLAVSGLGCDHAKVKRRDYSAVFVGQLVVLLGCTDGAGPASDVGAIGGSRPADGGSGGQSVAAGGAASGGVEPAIGGAPAGGSVPATSGGQSASGGASIAIGGAGGGAAVDPFGITKLYPDLAEGMQWTARWGAESPRSFEGQDPGDPWFDADHGDASYRVDGDGTLKISGNTPRMYVHDPAIVRQWRDVEITMYFRRIAGGDSATAWGGMVSYARANHGTTDKPETDFLCDTRGLGARMRYDGQIDFEKEVAHPDSFALLQSPHAPWGGSLPQEVWIGHKHVVRDLPDGGVRQELYLDETDGQDGGDWRLVREYTDYGGEFGAGKQPCSPGLDAAMPLTNAPFREGSESGMPNITVYFRSDGVNADGLWYKWGSVREIEAN